MLPEEVDWRSGRALGDPPLGMTHASLVNAVVDLTGCEERVSRARAGITARQAQRTAGGAPS